MSDIDTAVVDSLKVLDLKWPIREADIWRKSRTPARNFFSLQALAPITTPEELLMRTILLGLLAVAGIAIATPVVSPASAQVRIETPAGDVRVGPGHDRDRDRDYGRRRYRDHGCRTIVIRRDDGSVRRIRRCD